MPRHEDQFDTSVSRRDLISRARLLVGGAALVAGALAASPALAKKMPQSAAAYQPRPKGSARCSGCALFLAPRACKVVDGDISPDGWCSLYAPKA